MPKSEAAAAARTSDPTASLSTAVPSTAANSARGLAVILVVGAIVRALIWLWFADLPPRVDDELDYNGIAVNLVERGTFAAPTGQITSIRPPLYPGFVALVYRLVGLDATGQPTAACYQAVRGVQALISLLTAALVYRLAADMYSEKIGLWAAGLYCFYPSLLVYNNLLLTEVLFTFFLVLVAWSVAAFLRTEATGYLALAGLFIGLGASTRSVLWMLPPVLVVFLLVASRASFARRVVGSVAMAAVFAAVITPWTIRNTRLEKTLVTIDSMGGRNLMMGNYEYTPLYRSWDAISVGGEQAWYRVLVHRYPEFRQMTQGQRDKLAMREGIRFIRAHPGLTAKRDLVKFLNFWQLEREIVSAAGRGWYGPLSAAVVVLVTLSIFGSYAVSLLFGVFGVVMAPPRSWAVHAWLLLLMAFVCGLHTLVFAHSRYHVPLMPLVMIYTAAAIVRRQELWSRRRGPAFWVAATLAAMIVSGWIFEIVVVDYERFAKMLRDLM